MLMGSFTEDFVELTLQVQGHPETPILTCHGHVICGNEAEALHAAILRLLAVAERVTVELRFVRKMDCAGLGAIIDGFRVARHQGKSLEISAAPRCVRILIHATGLNGTLAPAEQGSCVGTSAA